MLPLVLCSDVGFLISFYAFICIEELHYGFLFLTMLQFALYRIENISVSGQPELIYTAIQI